VPQPLQGSHARLGRARKHLAELKREVRRFRKAYREAMRVHQYRNSFSYSGPADVGVPDSLSVMTSDTLFNQRCALDYLVYALAEFDSQGESQEDTQLPITDSPAKFQGALRAGRLPGVSEEHVAAVEELQPYDGRDKLQWLRILREFSNADKHRHLNALTMVVTGIFTRPGWIHQDIFTILGEATRWDIARRQRPLRAVTQTERPGVLSGIVSIPDHLLGKMDVKLDLAVDVAFAHGPPAVEALELFQTQIRALVDAFEPEFEG
jgi:hypothetical protein